MPVITSRVLFKVISSRHALYLFFFSAYHFFFSSLNLMRATMQMSGSWRVDKSFILTFILSNFIQLKSFMGCFSLVPLIKSLTIYGLQHRKIWLFKLTRSWMSELLDFIDRWSKFKTMNLTWCQSENVYDYLEYHSGL